MEIQRIHLTLKDHLNWGKMNKHSTSGYYAKNDGKRLILICSAMTFAMGRLHVIVFIRDDIFCLSIMQCV